MHLIRRCALTVACVLLGLLPGRGSFAVTPSDPFFSQQWYLNQIEAPRAWDTTVGNAASVVAVLDVGVDLDHPDFRDAIWVNPGEVPGNGRDDDGNGYIDDVHGWDFVANDNDPSPSYDVPGSDPKDLHHGTLVSGIIAARGNNGEGVAGLDWLARIMALRVLSSDGTGSVDVVVAAMRYALNAGATIINLSFVGDQTNIFFDEVLLAAEAKGVLVVAAGGNEDKSGRGDLDQFAAFPICAVGGGAPVLGVGATNARDEKASFSSYGSCVDLAAPGDRIAGTLFHDPQQTIIRIGSRVTAATFSQAYGGFFSGTSFATPIVVGAASLVRGILPAATPRDVVQLLQSTADPFSRLEPAIVGRLGAGRVNVARAVEEAVARATAVPTATRSTIRAARPLASLGEEVAVVVQVRSAFDRPVIGQAVTLRSDRPGDIIAPTSVMSDANGEARFTVRGVSEGIANFEAQVGDQRLGGERIVFARATTAPIATGSLLRGSASTVYLIGSDGKRYAFPDAQTFRSWYADASGVQRVGDVVLSAFPLGGLVTIRPGTFLVKIQTDPKVYAVEAGGTLRWVSTEADAVALFGPTWSTRVVDVPDAFFATYRLGAPVVARAHPTATLLEDASGERFLIVQATRRRFTSILALLQNGFQLRDAIRVPDVAYPDGPPIDGREVAFAQPVP